MRLGPMRAPSAHRALYASDGCNALMAALGVCRTVRVFYILPKIHKSLTNPPGRPIVASTESILSPLSVFLEKILTPLIKTTKSFIFGHFLSVLRQHGNVPPDSLLVTMDVNSLYTSITHEKGIAASKLLLENSGRSTTSIHLCLDLLRLVLYENYFLYEDTYYVQCQGTAMGSNVAPAYPNAYMNSFEESFVYTDVRYKKHIDCYLRYIDNIFFIWTGPTDTLQAFYQTLNSIYPELQITIHYDPNQISFLDTLVRKDDQGCLSTDLFTKPTDSPSVPNTASLPVREFLLPVRRYLRAAILPTLTSHPGQHSRAWDAPLTPAYDTDFH
ncbi:unnamed protein product, partial [Ranitomeya imitator]